MARRKISGGGIGRKRRSPAKRKTSTRRRRRGISGIGSIDIGGLATKIAGLGAGSIAARELNSVLIKEFPTLTPLVSALIQVGGGVILPMLVKNNRWVADMGDGMIANGVMVAAVNVGIISGTNPSMMSYRIGNANGGRLNVIAGGQQLRAIAGAPRTRNRRPGEQMY